MKTPRPDRRRPLPGGFALLAGILAILLAAHFGPDGPDETASGPAAGRAEVAVPAHGAEAPAPAETPVEVTAAAPGRVAPGVVPAPAHTGSDDQGSPAVAGMVIGRDPETGTWGPPTPEQLRELAAMRGLSEAEGHRVAKPDRPLPEVHHPGGHVSVELNGQFQEFTTVRIGPDGKPVFTCVDGPRSAERAIAEPVTPSLEER